MHLRTRQQEQAYRFLADAVRRAGEADTAALPPLRELAKRAGVGYNTMWKTAQLLVAEGAISIRPKRGIRIERPLRARFGQRSRPASSARLRRASQIAARIEHDIATGMYEQGTRLPSVKQLQGAYAACYRTVHAGIGELVERGCLVPDRRGYRVPSAIRSRTGGSIALITRSLEGGRLSDITPRTSTHLHHLENVCAQRGIALDVVPVHYGSGGTSAVTRLVSTPRRRDRVLGFVLWTTILNAEMLNYIMTSIAPLGKPIAILDEVNRLHLLESWHRRMVRTFTMAVSPLCGILVGQHLVRRGHRSVAYITEAPDDEAGIVENRRTGLIEALGDDAVVRTALPARKRVEATEELFGSMRDTLCSAFGVRFRPTTNDTTGDFELDIIRASVRRFSHRYRSIGLV
ncbi:MAG: GntR family transcriptional regulator, partial [Chitinivibrionales bacterium]|nr:GntR family transcriptional regulator [Chitinivibrionales bacterium]